MIRLLDKTKVSWLDYLFVFCIIIYAGRATVFTRDLGDIRTLGNAFALVITFICFVHNRVRFTRQFFISIAVFLLYAILTSIKNKMINPFWISQWVIWLTISFVMCQGLGERLFVIVESALFQLCIIGLILWIIQLVKPVSIELLVRSLNFSKPYGGDYANNTVSANMIVYTLSSDVNSDSSFYFIKRNPGFAWEPGAFSSMICLGIFCNILRTNFRFYRNFPLLVFLVALFSTQSTTGFMTLFIMLIVWILVNKKYVWTIIVIPLLFAAFSLPFLRDKIIMEYQSLETINISQIHGGSLSRTFSFILDFQEFLRHPIIGLGGWAGGSYLNQMGYEVAAISGIGDILVRFGAIMTLLFAGLLVNASKCISYIWGTPNSYILVVVVLAMMYSYNLWTAPLFIAFWMFSVYCPASIKKKLFDEV